jgi:hypothetical protein
VRARTLTCRMNHALPHDTANSMHFWMWFFEYGGDVSRTSNGGYSVRA